MKATVVRLMSIAMAICTVAFGWALRSYPAWDLSAEVSAFDIGIFALFISIFLQSLPGLVYNNFLFLQQKKDWRDFWSGDVLEYFYRSDKGREVWMLARGRFILYLLSCVLSIGLLIAYINIRH
ncbi:hypothetical protein [Massilia genomosp. 1]|uniref:DUF3899 domain-containing protein n=1 Tax=Massilia genomosp. 1 TaxID=2609280 RepID=A0ABX0MWS2_9BURK|nr:hypothetical protein [Massilia genomosp. 1]NHZ67148.1 hypothetical protein [Massilia genomosp. 1]